ncbi:hypothetical protein GCM10010228_69370 [Streptomyces massasporeus]|nr:hypothetical protein GCM10010228_69370 [Streptomyces massasporeus]
MFSHGRPSTTCDDGHEPSSTCRSGAAGPAKGGRSAAGGKFGNGAHTKAAYDLWPDTDETAPLETGRVGEESVFLAHSGSSGTVYGCSRSGTVIARVGVEDAGADPTDAHDALAATLKRLQHVQGGRRATATAHEIAAMAQTQR